MPAPLPSPPATLETCDGRIPRDPHPHVLRFSQWLFFGAGQAGAQSGGKARDYLILPHHRLVAAAPPKQLPWLRAVAGELLARLRVGADLASGRLPGPDGPLAKLRAAARDEAIANLPANLPEAQVRARYASWLRTAQTREAALWRRLCATAGLPGLPRPENLAAAEAALHEALFPRPFAPLATPHAHFALCAIYEQQWTPLGYTRGDLVGSISLAPGEQVTLEVHSWDKTTFKSEDELNAESELRVSNKTFQRDTAQVVDEMATQSGSKLTRQFSLGLPAGNGEIPLTGSASVGAESTQEIKDSLKSTVDRTSERTQEAASTLKNQRKTRLEISRDAGRESKQTRVLVNTNRGRTLNCYYFEILANYRAETRLVELRPCLLVPYPRRPLTRRWVLAHEFVLRQALLDASFLPGFEAARTLELAGVLEAMQALPPASSAGSEAACASARGAILRAASALEESVGEAIAALTAPTSLLAGIGGPRAYRFFVQLNLDGDTLPLRRLLYASALRAGGRALEALAQLRAGESGPARAALEAFFAAVSPADFVPAISSSRVSEGLSLAGLVTSLAERLVFGGLLEEMPDDAGLSGAVAAAAACLAGAAGAPASPGRPTTRAASATPPPGADANTGYATTAATPKEKIPLLRLAEATVEYNRLTDHLREYAPHYQQAVWLRTHPDERARWLRAQEFAAAVVSDEILGFENDKAIHPIVDLPAVKGVLDFAALLKNLPVKGVAAQTALLSLPTSGTVLESTLGQCDAVEDYIQQSRALELRQKAALAAQDEAEVERRRQRLAAAPPELGEFVSPAPCGCGGGYPAGSDLSPEAK